MFSIVIPTYNTKRVLMECLDALCNQTGDTSCLEVIIVNDGGDAAMSDKISRFRDRIAIKYIYQENRGPAAARNLGVKNSKGEIILFLDDDSLPTKDWLKSVIKAWQTFPDYDGIGGYTNSEVTDSIYCRVNSDFFNWYLEQYSSEDSSSFLVTCNAGYRKEILSRIGGFDDRFKKASGEDRDLNIKILKSGGKMRLDRNIIVYHDRDLTLRSFIRKNYNYGKAAYHIYTIYHEQNYLPMNSYVDLFVAIFKKYKSMKNRSKALLLIALSQAATGAGYYKALFTKEKI